MEILLSTKVTINNFLFWVSQSWSRGAGLSRAVRRLYDLEIIREGATVLAAGATLTSDTFFDVELWREAGDRRKQTGKGDKNCSELGVAVGSGISGLLLPAAGQHSQDIGLYHIICPNLSIFARIITCSKERQWAECFEAMLSLGSGGWRSWNIIIQPISWPVSACAAAPPEDNWNTIKSSNFHAFYFLPFPIFTRLPALCSLQSTTALLLSPHHTPRTQMVEYCNQDITICNLQDQYYNDCTTNKM